MTSEEYWKDREKQALANYIDQEEAYSERIKQIYGYMQDSIQAQINSFYTKYATSSGITMADAVKAVSELDIDAYSRKAARYVKDKDFSSQANTEMKLYNATMKINRLEMLKSEIGLECILNYQEFSDSLELWMESRAREEFERQAGILGEGVKNATKRAKQLVNASYQNATFSERIWLYQGMLKGELSKLLSEGLIQGKHPNVLAKELEKLFGVQRNYAERLMRTELCRVQIAAQEASYKANGYEKYMFIATEDLKTCETCAALDGKVFELKEMQIGDNAPPLHPNCRCSTAAYMESMESPVPVIEDVTQEYLDNATPGEGEITHDAGADEKDIATSEFLFEKFGGDIRTLEVENIDGRDLKTPDALWNGVYWEYKNSSTIKSIDDRIRHAASQLNEMLGRKGIADSKVGIVLDIANKKQSIDETTDAAERVLLSRAKNDTDLMIKDGKKILKVFRMQK